LVGSAAVRRLVEAGFEVVGFENDMRARLFGADASTEPVVRRLEDELVEFRRRNIDIRDAEACLAFHRAPRKAAVYNLGGGRFANCSMLEAIRACENIAGRKLEWELSDAARIGDHRWWISDLAEFQRDYPGWSLHYDIDALLRDIYEANADHWATG